MKVLFLALTALALPLGASAAPFKNSIVCQYTESLGSSLDKTTRKYGKEKVTTTRYEWNEPDDMVDGDKFDTTLFGKVWVMPLVGPGRVDRAPSYDILMVLFDEQSGAGVTNDLKADLDSSGVAYPMHWDGSYNRKNQDRLKISCDINQPAQEQK